MSGITGKFLYLTLQLSVHLDRAALEHEIAMRSVNTLRVKITDIRPNRLWFDYDVIVPIWAEEKLVQITTQIESDVAQAKTSQRMLGLLARPEPTLERIRRGEFQEGDDVPF